MGRGELEVGGLTLSGRCGWGSCNRRLTATLETLGICFLRKLRRHAFEPRVEKQMVQSQQLVQVLACLENPIQVGLDPGRKSDL